MRLQLDEQWLEAVVFLCASGRRPGVPPEQIRRFNAERERLYRLLDPEARNAAFFGLHLEWFREWGLERTLQDAVAEYPNVARSLLNLAVRRLRGKDQEGAELYVKSDGSRSGVIAVRPERFIRESEARLFLRREFMHLDDMLTPAFAYTPVTLSSGTTATEEQSIRERYRLLWGITVDARLSQREEQGPALRAEHQARFDAIYAFWEIERREAVFKQLWSLDQPRHPELLKLASEGPSSKSARGAVPGGSCPLCGFRTFDWEASGHIPEETSTRILREFPNWQAEDGICRRCFESYRALEGVTVS